MPLDPSIFLRGAELQANNAARTQATIGNFFDKLAEAKKAKPLDLENAAQEWVYRKSSGLPTTPELDAKAKAYDVFQTSKNSVNPATGEPYPQNRSIFDTFGGIEPTPYKSPWTPPETPGILPTGAIPNGSPMPPMVGNQPVMNDLGGELLPPVGDNYNQVSGGVNRDAARGLPTLPTPSNAKQAQTSFEAQTDIGKTAAEADIKASQAGAEKRSTMTQEAEVNSEQRRKALAEIQTNLESLLKDAEGTPSGMIEGAAATASSALGFPNEAAKKRARFESGKAISGLQSRISFLKGQGTITDAEAKQAMAFIPEPNDPYDIKIEKLQGGIDYINGAIGAVNANPKSAPGFKYLGTE